MSQSLIVVIDPGGLDLTVVPDQEPVLSLGAPTPSRTLNSTLTVGGVAPFLTVRLHTLLKGSDLAALQALITRKNLEKSDGALTPTAIHYFFQRFTEVVSGSGVAPRVAPVVPGTTPIYTTSGALTLCSYYPVITGWLSCDFLQGPPDQLIPVDIEVQ